MAVTDPRAAAAGAGPMTDAEDMAVLAGAALALSGSPVHGSRLTVTVERPAWLQAVEWARDELGCSFVDFLCGVAEPAGITVVAHLRCPDGRYHLRLRTQVPADDPSLSTATGLFPGADRHERETRARFGVIFTGHPDLDPLLLPEGGPGAVVLPDHP